MANQYLDDLKSTTSRMIDAHYERENRRRYNEDSSRILSYYDEVVGDHLKDSYNSNHHRTNKLHRLLNKLIHQYEDVDDYGEKNDIGRAIKRLEKEIEFIEYERKVYQPDLKWDWDRRMQYDEYPFGYSDELFESDEDKQKRLEKEAREAEEKRLKEIEKEKEKALYRKFGLKYLG